MFAGNRWSLPEIRRGSLEFAAELRILLEHGFAGRFRWRLEIPGVHWSSPLLYLSSLSLLEFATVVLDFDFAAVLEVLGGGVARDFPAEDVGSLLSDNEVALNLGVDPSNMWALKSGIEVVADEE
ncbi:hypothetical protein Dimus_004018 [Dionaea muscipula]